jgi:hypothetical protein
MLNMNFNSLRLWKIGVLRSLAVGLGCAVTSYPALASDIIFPGIQAKASAGAGQTVSRGATALFFNPANLLLSERIQPEADLSAANIAYAYQNSETETFDSAVLNIKTPMVSAGIAWRPRPDLAFGIAAVPFGTGSAQIDYGVPIELSPGIFQALDVAKKQVLGRVASGVAWQLFDNVEAGAGVIYSSERTSISTKNAGTDRTIIEASYAGKSAQLNIGLRGNIGAATKIAASYKTAAGRTYAGILAVNVAPRNSPDSLELQPFEGRGYDPATLGLGFETRFGPAGLFLDYVREMWAAGRGVLKSGLGTDTPTIDLKSTNNIALGIKYWLRHNHMLQISVAKNDGNMGNGDVVPADQAARQVGGVQLGQLEAIPRMIFAAGYSYQLGIGRQIQVAAMSLNGTKDIPSGYAQSGTFQLSMTSLTVGANFAF